MIFERIVRGAVRTQTYLNLKARRYCQTVVRAYKLNNIQQSVAVAAMVSHLATSGVPTHAPVQRALAASEDADPSPKIVAAAIDSAPAYPVTLRVSSSPENIIAVVDAKLNSVSVGKSYATIKDEEAEQQRQAEIQRQQEAQRLAEAARQAKLAAQRAAEAVSRAQQATISYTQDQAQIISIIRQAAAKYGVDAELMIRIARAESGFNPNARNRSSAATGLFQFMPSTYANSPQARDGKSIYDPVANAEAAAYKLSFPGGYRAWSASQHAWGSGS